MCLPCNFHNETNCHAGILVSTAEAIYHIKLLIGELLLGNFLYGSPCFLRSRMVVVLVLIGGPPYGVLGILIHYDELILGGTSGIYSGENINCAELSLLTNLKAFQTSLGLFLEQLLIGRIVDDLRCSGNAILA